MNRQARSQLFGDLDVSVELDAQIGAMTWFGIGGRADVLVRPHSIEALSSLVQRCAQSQTPIEVLGRGANLLVDDDGIDGIIVMLDDPIFSELKFNRKGEVDSMLAMAGADIFKTVNELARQGLSGFEQMAGIPGTIGGAIRMNAGGQYGCIGDCVETVKCLSFDGEQLVYHHSQLEFDYRRTNLPPSIILSATFRLEPTDPVTVRARVLEIVSAKSSSQPMADKSAGCAFRNPPGSDGVRIPAGRLIDEAGLKGACVGGASVSTQHANFITTGSKATATDVRNLMALVKQRVLEHHGVTLEPEVVFWQRAMGAES